ncbi:loricrin [Condylostylus longicornis]|uniref:loricrin n=1 Tax=Condylostylus longicornis TaxID=2530218 RepID=UPI00244DCC87|nr:loricrin [Condylostylus longicornis]
MSKFTQIQLVLAILIAISNKANSFTKYGRGCQDIGCLPNQVCVMAQDSCNLGQRDGKECGSYPTCKNTGAAKPPVSDIEHKPTFNTNANADNNSPYGGSNSGNTQSNGGLYPSLPNQNNMQGGSYYPGVNPGGYVPPGYNPSQGGGQSPYYGNGGYQPQPNNNNGGNRPAYNGGGGYSGGGSGGYSGGAGGGGYSGGGGYNRGGYSDPSGGQKDKGNGFLTGILQNPHVSSAISGIIAGQIQKAITGRNEPNQPNRGGYNDGYGGGAGTGSSGSSGAGNLIGGLISGYLSGGGGSSSQNRGSGGSGGGLGFIGDLIGGGGSSSSNRGGGGAGGAISDFFSSKNRGGLFSENPSSNTNSHQQYSSAKKDYPTQPPYNYNYNG